MLPCSRVTTYCTGLINRRFGKSSCFYLEEKKDTGIFYKMSTENATVSLSVNRNEITSRYKP
jgi:hypothetical protein